MDAVEVLTNLDRIHPYFQPIFSADEHSVIGYEVLGRYNDEQMGIISLGPFFQDENIPEEYRLEVDNYILEQALKIITQHNNQDFLIFLNRDPELLMVNDGEDVLELLQKYLPEKQLNRVVLELSQKKYKGDLVDLQHLLTYYKTYGIKIAIDHLGDDSQLDLISGLSPHILKVNLEKLKSAGWDSYQEVLYTLGLLARKIGATLLFESIETVYQLQFAWKNGGRYYQGFYLASPDESLVQKDILKGKLRDDCQRFIIAEKKKLEKIFSIKRDLYEKLQGLIVKSRKLNDYTELLKSLAESLSPVCFRLYICDEEGFQKSENIFKTDGNWIVQENYRDKNWSWRPYFLENIIKMRNEKRGILSDCYSDIETGETIRTFSLQLNDSDFLFLDLSYEYLYENDVLL
ncbi:EAL domain-containing protein [Peribacillus alkalitolerans]|uniref:EAL domain-containing protein n=1 Tax=Peribacillus alkalitolerans TaxID=1550385 RepID=UPI0013D82C5C|nr:EAL-associated domain-containing protein [Peribacillus alkalitolerans]